MRAFASIGLAVALCAAGFSAASAKPIPNGGLTLSETVAWLHAGGYKAEVLTRKDSDKPKYIGSASGGVNFYIDLYDCKADRCASLQFFSAFDKDQPMTAEKINGWNLENRYSRAYIDDEGDPYLEYDANLSPGGTYEALDDDLQVWTNSLGKFTTFIDW